MSYLEDCHRAHVERVMRLSRRAPEAGPMRLKPVPKVIEFDEKGKRIMPEPEESAEQDYPPLPVMLGPMVRLPKKDVPRIADVVRIVAAHYGMTKHKLLSRKRTTAIVRPRQVAMYVAWEIKAGSLPEIGRRMGGRDHTTALHAKRTIATLIEIDSTLAADIEAIKRALSEEFSVTEQRSDACASSGGGA